LEKEIVLKKLKILKTNKKVVLVFFALLWCISLIAQKDAGLAKDWSKQNKSIAYKKDSKYKGPEDWHSSPPNEINSSPETFFETEPERNIDGIISRNRSIEARKGGSEKNIKKPREIEIPEFNPPEFDDPDVDMGIDVDAPDPTKISKSTWRTLLFILLFAIVIVLLYFWLKRQNFSSKINQIVDENWNPEVITVSELESRLENALKNEVYREVIRIYFTMILQELIRLQLIKWRLEKTNQQYIYEVKNQLLRAELRKCTRYFDIVWYGEYNIDRDKYEEIQPHFTRFIQTLKAKKDE
jgi:hypothetical protein